MSSAVSDLLVGLKCIDAPEVERVARRLKDRAKDYGLSQVGLTAHQIEKTTAAGDLDAAQQLVAELKEQLQQAPLLMRQTAGDCEYGNEQLRNSIIGSTTSMKFELCYSLQIIGTIFVGAVQKTADTTQLYSKGASLAYDITLTRRKKQMLACEIVARVALLVREGKRDMSSDSTLAELVGSLNCVEKELVSLEQQRIGLGGAW